MEPSKAHGVKESDLAVWRRAHRRLRALERQLVREVSRIDAAPTLDRLFREIESLRQETTELFELAQMESVAHHVRTQRIGRYVEPPSSPGP